MLFYKTVAKFAGQLRNKFDFFLATYEGVFSTFKGQNKLLKSCLE